MWQISKVYNTLLYELKAKQEIVNYSGRIKVEYKQDIDKVTTKSHFSAFGIFFQKSLEKYVFLC